MGWVIASVGALALAVSQALTGHAAAIPVMWLMSVTSDVVHIAAAGAWIGGLFVILFAGLPAVSGAAPDDQPVVGRRLVHSYHRIATISVAVVAFTGIVNAKFRLGTWGALTTSSYGRVLLVKLMFVVLLLLFGLYHWNRVVKPVWASGVGARFRLSAAAEVVTGAIVLAVTAVLLSAPLP
jgi:putative copper export protein